MTPQDLYALEKAKRGIVKVESTCVEAAVIHCPQCGSEDVSVRDRSKKKKLFRRMKRAHAYCRACNHDWQTRRVEVTVRSGYNPGRMVSRKFGYE